VYEPIEEDLETKPTTSEVVQTSAWAGYFEKAKNYVLPFGFVARNIWNNFLNYCILFQWWFTIFWVGGLVLFAVQLVRKKIKWEQAQYVIIFGVVSLWLITVYGSWNFHDNIDPSKVTIGNSYLRYWLPSFVLATPIMAWLAMNIKKFLKIKTLQIIWLVFVVLYFAILGTWTTFWSEDEGLAHVQKHLWRYESVAQKVFEVTEDDAIIITDRSDKIFFPERRIAYPLQNEAMYNILETMYFVAPPYYYGVAFTQDALDHLNDTVFNERNLFLERIESFDNEALYMFKYFKQDESSS
jgi:hypothetical protein